MPPETPNRKPPTDESRLSIFVFRLGGMVLVILVSGALSIASALSCRGETQPALRTSPPYVPGSCVMSLGRGRSRSAASANGGKAYQHLTGRMCRPAPLKWRAPAGGCAHYRWRAEPLHGSPQVPKFMRRAREWRRHSGIVQQVNRPALFGDLSKGRNGHSLKLYIVGADRQLHDPIALRLHSLSSPFMSQTNFR